MNDPFRKEYKELTDNQKLQVGQIKVVAEHLLEAMDEAVSPEERSEKSRMMNIARTNLEQSVMWAVKAVTTAE